MLLFTLFRNFRVTDTCQVAPVVRSGSTIESIVFRLDTRYVKEDSFLFVYVCRLLNIFLYISLYRADTPMLFSSANYAVIVHDYLVIKLLVIKLY